MYNTGLYIINIKVTTQIVISYNSHIKFLNTFYTTM